MGKGLLSTGLPYLFSLHRPSGPIQSISLNVRVRRCMYPLVKYRLNVLLTPLTKVLGCFFYSVAEPIFFTALLSLSSKCGYFFLSLGDHVGLRPGRPIDNGPQEGDYSAWVAWRNGKVRLPGLSFLSPLSLSPRLPRQISPPPVVHYL